jgi:hypothetical protein
MGRAAVIVLALANLGYFAWRAGALSAFDLLPTDLAAAEPHRLARQIRPERLRIISPTQEEQEARTRSEATRHDWNPETTKAPVPAMPHSATQPSEPARPPASSP